MILIIIVSIMLNWLSFHPYSDGETQKAYIIFKFCGRKPRSINADYHPITCSGIFQLFPSIKKNHLIK